MIFWSYHPHFTEEATSSRRVTTCRAGATPARRHPGSERSFRADKPFPPTLCSGNTNEPMELPRSSLPRPHVSMLSGTALSCYRETGRGVTRLPGEQRPQKQGGFGPATPLSFRAVNCGDRKALLVLGGRWVTLRASVACLRATRSQSLPGQVRSRLGRPTTSRRGAQRSGVGPAAGPEASGCRERSGARGSAEAGRACLGV